MMMMMTKVLETDTRKYNYANQKNFDFPETIFMKLTNAQLYQIQISYTKFYPNQSIYKCGKNTKNFPTKTPN